MKNGDSTAICSRPVSCFRPANRTTHFGSLASPRHSVSSATRAKMLTSEPYRTTRDLARRRRTTRRPRPMHGRPTTSIAEAPKPLEIAFRRLEAGAMNLRAGCDRHVCRRDGDTPGTSATREIVRGAPDVLVHRQVGEYGREVAQHPLFPIAARTVPQLELDDWAPTGLARLERSLDTAAGQGIAVRSQQVNPGRRINQDQWTAPAAGAAPEARPPSSDRNRCQRTSRDQPCGGGD